MALRLESPMPLVLAWTAQAGRENVVVGVAAFARVRVLEEAVQQEDHPLSVAPFEQMQP